MTETFGTKIQESMSKNGDTPFGHDDFEKSLEEIAETEGERTGLSQRLKMLANLSNASEIRNHPLYKSILQKLKSQAPTTEFLHSAIEAPLESVFLKNQLNQCTFLAIHDYLQVLKQQNVVSFPRSANS